VAAHAIFEDRLYSDERFAFAGGPAISRSIALSRGATSDETARINRHFIVFIVAGENRLIAALLTNSRRKTDYINGEAIISDESD
jgi:hypothetical protein